MPIVGVVLIFLLLMSGVSVPVSHLPHPRDSGTVACCNVSGYSLFANMTFRPLVVTSACRGR